ncbi:MAG TPA: UDP-N-acetylglucosamine 2-epimerase (non-hydrolyzing) [Candidatus Saccharimonadales bacterium]|nr:UDP-N-acetylglucosamine 2-epimerase (non-hydrolyzing) [Candidatus Saccharimonadales bacterium]
MKKLISIVGVRPQFVKAAMICAAVNGHNQKQARENRIQHLLLHTGQHYDYEMAAVFFQQLPLPEPDFNLGVGSGSHGAQTATMLKGIEKVLLKEKPDCVIVYGDTNSTLAGALAAVKLHIPTAHVESGLRSFNRVMPEEINRIATDHVSDLLFCPTKAAVQLLAKEGIRQNVYFSGDVMLDAVKAFAPVAAKRSVILNTLGVAPAKFILTTIHRAENTDSLERMRGLVETLCRVQQPIIFSVHPRLREKLNHEAGYQKLGKQLAQAAHLKMVAPLSYLDMLHLESKARLIMTDSGGVQKEAYFVGTPCLTLRDETEWTETLQDGWNHLAGASPEKVLPLVRSLWTGPLPETKPALAGFGNGKAAGNIVNSLLELQATKKAS